MRTGHDYLLNAVDIGKRFGHFIALEHISIDIRRGEFLTLLGPSGSGKTTFLMILAGFEQPNSGVLRENGVDITRRLPEERNFGMVFQGYALFPHLSVKDNIAFPLRVRSVGREQCRSKVERLLEVVGLHAHADKYPHQLSGGQQQRVAIARALVFEPDMLLLDEPLSALDKNLRAQLQTELQRIHRQVGTTFVFVTHDQDEALALSDRIAIFDKGRLMQIDSPQQIYNAPKSRFVAEFLGQMNLFPLAELRREGAESVGLFAGHALRSATCLDSAGTGHVLAVRPEQMRLHIDPPAQDAGNRLPCTVAGRTYQGASSQLQLLIGNSGQGRASIAIDNEHPALQLRPGDSAWLSWPVEQSLLLDG